MMDRIIVVSNHAKQVFENSVYEGSDPQTGRKVVLKLEKPMEVVSYPVRNFDKDNNFKLELEHDFNYLLMAQWSERKNIENTIKWFVEENFDQDVGLIIKTNSQANCKIDQEFTLQKRLKPLLKHTKTGSAKSIYCTAI